MQAFFHEADEHYSSNSKRLVLRSLSSPWLLAWYDQMVALKSNKQSWAWRHMPENLRPTWATQWGQSQLELQKEILSPKKKKEKDKQASNDLGWGLLIWKKQKASYTSRGKVQHHMSQGPSRNTVKRATLTTTAIFTHDNLTDLHNTSRNSQHALEGILRASWLHSFSFHTPFGCTLG